MHIAFLLEDIYFMGGGERVASNMANYCCKKYDMDVTIICLSTREQKPIFPLENKVNLQFLNISRDSAANKLFNRLQSFIQINSHLKKHPYDIILGIGTFPNILLASIKGSGFPKRIGCEHNSFASVSFLWKRLREFFYPRLDYVVSLTEKDFPLLKRLNSHACVIPNSHSMHLTEHALLKEKQILAIGRFSYQKGYEFMIEVFDQFSKKNKEWNLKIIGDGPLKNKIEKDISSRGLDSRIKISSPTLNIIREYMNSSVFLLTSRYEGLPMVLLEAQACGLPIVAFNCDTGPSDIVNSGTDGYLIDCFEIEKMVDALLDLTGDFQKLKVFGSKAVENSRKFSDEIVYRKWYDLFQSLMN